MTMTTGADKRPGVNPDFFLLDAQVLDRGLEDMVCGRGGGSPYDEYVETFRCHCHAPYTSRGDLSKGCLGLRLHCRARDLNGRDLQLESGDPLRRRRNSCDRLNMRTACEQPREDQAKDDGNVRVLQKSPLHEIFLSLPLRRRKCPRRNQHEPGPCSKHRFWKCPGGAPYDVPT